MLRGSARTMVNDFNRARSLVLSGRQNLSGWKNEDRTEHAGIRFVSNTRYELFVDKDRKSNGSGSEVVIEVRDLPDPIQMTSGPKELRFGRKGTVNGSTKDHEYILENPNTKARKVVRVAFSGKSDIPR